MYTYTVPSPPIKMGKLVKPDPAAGQGLEAPALENYWEAVGNSRQEEDYDALLEYQFFRHSKHASEIASSHVRHVLCVAMSW